MEDEKSAWIKALGTGRKTRKELADMLGLDERTVRNRIHDLRRTQPVISYSSAQGYRIARGVEDLEDARHTLREMRKRAAEELVGASALEAFIDRIQQEAE